MSLDVDAVVTEISARGLRPTRQRRAVVEAVATADACLSPLDVFRAARAGCPDLGLTTVYRTLELLHEIGVLRRVHGPDGCEGLVPATAAHGHSVVCSACGRVTEFTACDMSAVAEAARRQTGYDITGHFLQLSGLCAGCAAARGGRGRGSRPRRGGAGASREDAP